MWESIIYGILWVFALLALLWLVNYVRGIFTGKWGG